MATKGKDKINKRLSYFTKAIKPKDIRLWAPDNPDESTLFGTLVRYLEWTLGIPRIEKENYANDFTNFYDMEIAAKYDGVVEGKEHDNFCSTKMNGGVNEDYIKDVANEELNATIISLSFNPNTSINSVYALVTFRVSESKKAIKIHTLCGNQVLPPSGEGSRLMKLLENAGYEFGLHKILLNPVDTAVDFYVDKKYRNLRSSESQETSDGDSSYHHVMQKNVRAQKRWAKIRTAVKLATIMRSTKNATKRRELEKKYAKLTKEKDATRPIKLDIKTMREQSTKIVPGNSFNTNVKFIPPKTKKLGIPSKTIVPGESFVIPNMKAEISERAARSLAREAKTEMAVMVDNLKKTSRKRTTTTKTGKGKGKGKGKGTRKK